MDYCGDIMNSGFTFLFRHEGAQARAQPTPLLVVAALVQLENGSSYN